MQTRNSSSRSLFIGSIVILLVLASLGFGLYLTKSSQTTTVTASGSVAASAFPLVGASGQMFHSGWAVIGVSESGQYVLSVHAEGLETTAGSDYIVEAAQSTGSMAVVPVGANATASEFEANSNGVGNFVVVLSQNPTSAYENIQLVFLPGMEMSNATVVATATLTMTH